MHKNERGSDSENFGARIMGIRVSVENIWAFEVVEAKLSFWEVPGVYLELQKVWRASV
jgi:hypothetical protein